jgi:hypothetical protein
VKANIIIDIIPVIALLVVVTFFLVVVIPLVVSSRFFLSVSSLALHPLVPQRLSFSISHTILLLPVIIVFYSQLLGPFLSIALYYLRLAHIIYHSI